MRAGRGTGAMLALGVLAVATAAAGGEAGWQPDPKLIQSLEEKKPPWRFRESEVPAYRVPDPLVLRDGSRITSAATWKAKGRPQTLDLFREHVYGRSPEPPDGGRFETTEVERNALEGRATLKRVTITATAREKSFSFPAAVFIPNKRRGKVPAFILINNRAVSSADPSRAVKDGFWPVEEIIERGYAAAVFRTNDVDPDTKDEAARAKGVRGVWPNGGGKAGEDGWATIGAWAWGASRVLDWLLVGEGNAIDGKRVAVVGHSRGGKTALWAGAQDERFALAVSNDSGCGGAALSRRKFGETVERINRSFPYWFCGNFKQYNDREEALPVDQHQLLALMAPRAVYVASADEDLWADPRGEFLSLAHASPVFALFKNPDFKPSEMPPLDTPLVRGRLGYHIRRGGHNLTPYDWARFMDFADGLWKRK